MVIRFALPFLLLMSVAACNDPAVRTAELQAQLQTQVQASESFTLDPQGPPFAAAPYVQEDGASCKLYFSVSSVLPETFFQTGKPVLTKHPVLDACVTQLGSAQELGRLYFSKHVPALTSGEPTSHHSATSMSDFLHAAFEVTSAADAQAFLSCMASGLSDYFTRATSAHGDSESGYLVEETADTVHVHYDLTVMTITSYVSQLVKSVEAGGRLFVVFTAGTDGNILDAETYSHAGVKFSCQ